MYLLLQARLSASPHVSPSTSLSPIASFTYATDPCMYPPPVIGFFEGNRPPSFHPTKPPHLSTIVTRSIEQAADFTISLLLEPNSGLCVCVTRDGHVLLSRSIDPKTILGSHGVPLLMGFINEASDLMGSTRSTMEFDIMFLDRADKMDGNKEAASFKVLSGAFLRLLFDHQKMGRCRECVQICNLLC